jgi:uncharacterized glyoxalase superfamily protein PhnB
MMYAPEPQKRPPVVNRSAPNPTVVPISIYKDVAEAISWLNGAFGFTERLRAARPDGTVMHAQRSIGEGAIMMGAAGGECHLPHPNEVNQYVHGHVEDVDRHFDHAKQFGARIVKPLNNMQFGEMQYVAEELAGHRWVFSHSVAEWLRRSGVRQHPNPRNDSMEGSQVNLQLCWPAGMRELRT